MDDKKIKAKNKSIKLRNIFIRYLITFCVTTICLMSLLILSFLLCMGFGIILPSNYASNQLSEKKDVISSSDTITTELIPDLCKYALYTTDGAVKSGNLSSIEAKKAWQLTKHTITGQSFTRFYMKINRKNEICIIRYTYLAQYSNPSLRKFLPPPEILMFFLFILGFLTLIYLLASSFGRFLAVKMASMQHATERIQNQDLEFTVEPSGIAEIDNILFSVDQMKEALKTSLKSQWDLEQTRLEQISALAHDIKTPLTVVLGNAELLAETELSSEQEQYTGFVIENAFRMEQYVKTLIQMSHTETGMVFERKKIDSMNYMEEICRQMNALASTKGIIPEFHIGNLPPFFTADPDLLQRAIMNVVSNAVEYSKPSDVIQFMATSEDDLIKFCITDSGKGFSQEELVRATEQFYQGDKSRSSKNHYGMGLYITSSIINLHNGVLKVSNSPQTGGGEVTIEIPIFT